jgi:DNA-binding ferritin-like protein (Dps family)
LIKKISDKDKQDWQNFINSSDKLENKDQKIFKPTKRYIEKSIDLHVMKMVLIKSMLSLAKV